MMVNYIEKARAGRIAALASLENRSENVVTIFEDTFAPLDETELDDSQVLQFISRRPVDQLAA